MEARRWHEHYDPGVPASLDYDEVPLHAFLARSAERAPDRVAIAFQNARISYRELREDADRFAAALVELGVERGSTVAIQLPNIPQAVVAYYAALQLGARVVLTNPLYTAREIVHQWNDAGCSVAVTMDFLWDQRVRDLRGEVGVREFVVASIPEYLRFPLSWLAPFKLRRQDPPAIAKVPDQPNVHRFGELLRRYAPIAGTPPQVGFDEMAVVQYTGGTTGVSKGAVLTHGNLSSNVQQTAAWFSDARYAEEVVLTCLPLFHVFGMTVCMNLAVCLAGTMVLVPNPRDVKSLVKAVSKHRPTIFPGVPALFNSLNQFPGIESVDVSSVRYCLSGSAPIAADVQRRFEELTGSKIIEGFGMSETSPITHANPLQGVRKLGSIGVPVSDTDAHVVDVDDPDRELPLGEPGELIVRGPQVMGGYWNKPVETGLALHDGWMRTGDLATEDEDGYFRIVGRKKDMINVGGFKVYPDEVDDVLMAHPAVLESATIGIEHEGRGETVKSFVVLVDGRSATADELVAHCRESLAPYKVPREVEFLDELPKSSVLKVLRRELRDREEAKGSGGATGG